MSGTSEVLIRRSTGAFLGSAVRALAMFVCFLTLLRANDRGEYEVKAAFLVNFTHFVEWPDTGSSMPFSLCVVGPDPFGPVLDKVVGTRTVNGRPMIVKRFPRMVSEGSCQIVFVGDMDRSALVRLIPVLESSHSLTVGDSLDFAEKYGVIGFIVENQRVSLALHPGHAARCGLKINSQLMRVATIISGEGRPAE